MIFLIINKQLKYNKLKSFLLNIREIYQQIKLKIYYMILNYQIMNLQKNNFN